MKRTSAGTKTRANTRTQSRGLARRIGLATFASAFAVTACGAGPTPPPPPPSALPTTTPVAAAAPVAARKETPPGPLEAKASPFPAVAKKTLPNGLRVSVVASHALPVVELRVVVHTGSGFGAPGVGEITAKMLKEGGTRAHTSSELVNRIETLGSSLDVGVTPDATRLSMGVVRGELGDALEILGEVVRTPRFDGAELVRVKTRVADQAQDSARSSGTWSANRVLFHTLFPTASPYARYGVVPSEVAKVDGAAIADFHKRFYVPSNVEIVVAGDVDADALARAIDKTFGDWKAGPPSKVAPTEFPPPTAPDVTRVIVANRPKSVQSDVVVTQLLPERHAPAWPTDRVALQVFGGGMTNRLFEDVREKRSLAYATSGNALELAHDAQPLFAYAGTQTAKTVDAVQGVIDDLAGMRTSPPTDEEVASARRFLSDIFAVRMETIGSIASMVAQLREIDLPDDYWDTYRTALRAVTASDVDGEAARIFTPAHALIIVAGDGDVIAEPLTRFGDVTVVDPEHDFRVLRTLPASKSSASPSPASPANNPAPRTNGTSGTNGK